MAAHRCWTLKPEHPRRRCSMNSRVMACSSYDGERLKRGCQTCPFRDRKTIGCAKSSQRWAVIRADHMSNPNLVTFGILLASFHVGYEMAAGEAFPNSAAS